MATAAIHDVPAPIHPLVATVGAPSCALTSPDGQMRPTGVQGLYVSDTRVLHGAEIDVQGLVPDGLGWSVPDPVSTLFPAVVRELGDPSPDPTVRVDRRRTVRPDGMDETIRVRNAAAEPVRTTLTLRLTPDLLPMMSVKAGRPPVPVTPEHHPDGAVGWSGPGIGVTIAADAGALAADDGRSLRWDLDLPAGADVTLAWSVRVRDTVPFLVRPTAAPSWSVPDDTGADPRLDRFLRRALDDLDAMRLAVPEHPEDTFIAAGVPWFLTLFGRDSIWAARMLLPLDVETAAGTLRALGRLQGTRVDVLSGEEPGKIMHEMRREDRRVRGLGAEKSMPAVYYGTIDATPLWISLLADAWRWGMPDQQVAALMPVLRRAIDWLGESTGDGFLSYVDRSGQGLANQGWKDSGTAVRFRDGRMAAPPIALCEVQGYAHRAALDAAELLEAFGHGGDDPDRWRGYASGLATRFRDRFWVDGPLGPYPAEALDVDGQPVDALTSNIGHLPGTGLLSPAEESRVARLIGKPTLSGGYGLRTMSDLDAAFDPLSYHCGSVWPHDTAITLLALATMGDDPDARAAIATLTEGLLTAAETFGFRLPELYSGDPRTDGPPLPHPAACRPQAWSAAAAVSVLAAVRGLTPRPRARARG